MVTQPALHIKHELIQALKKPGKFCICRPYGTFVSNLDDKYGIRKDQNWKYDRRVKRYFIHVGTQMLNLQL